MASIEDWAAKAARQIKCQTSGASEARIAAIIATFAEPLVKMLREPRLHLHVEGDPYLCCPKCTQCEGTRNSSWNGECHPDCGVDKWNARVDAAFAGVKKTDAESLGSYMLGRD